MAPPPICPNSMCMLGLQGKDEKESTEEAEEQTSALQDG